MPIDKTESKDFMRTERNNLMAGINGNCSDTLSKLPDVRMATIMRGKALIADPNYPSQEQIRKIAKLLARKLEQENLSRCCSPHVGDDLFGICARPYREVTLA